MEKWRSRDHKKNFFEDSSNTHTQIFSQRRFNILQTGHIINIRKIPNLTVTIFISCTEEDTLCDYGLCYYLLFCGLAT